MTHRRTFARFSQRGMAAGRAAAVTLACVSVGLSLAGCESGGQGAATGATVGALSGLVIGSMSGNAGKGAAIGAVVGGAGGAVVGDQNRRQNERNAQAAAQNQAAQAAQARSAADTAADRDRLALARFARSWTIAGWQTVDGQRRLVSGTATGSVENAFFVTLDVRVTDQITGTTSTGDVWFASEPGRGITMNSRFDTLPIPVTHAGTVSADRNVFTLDETTPGVVGRRTVIRFISDTEFVVDDSERVGGRTNPIGSLSFSASR
jgi:uncharacterized protein YcfJ